jgi:hypothetical protein
MSWIQTHATLITWWVLSLSTITFVLGLVLMPILIIRMSPDYFLHPRPPAESWRSRHPALRVSTLIVKNVLGVILLLAGLAMLVLPGQGIITILVAISLLNFPGKRDLELKIVRQRRVLQAINWIRTRAKRPPLVLPPP